MPVDQFVYTLKERPRCYDDFCVPTPREYWHVEDFHETLRQMWQIPEICNIEKATPVLAARTAVTSSNLLKERFLEHATKWDRETTYLSSTPKMILHDSYQKIMAMGPDVVPLLLQDLQENRRSWFWALRHITNANPVPPEDQGNLDKMVAAWVAWGRRERLI